MKGSSYNLVKITCLTTESIRFPPFYKTSRVYMGKVLTGLRRERVGVFGDTTGDGGVSVPRKRVLPIDNNLRVKGPGFLLSKYGTFDCLIKSDYIITVYYRIL